MRDEREETDANDGYTHSLSLCMRISLIPSPSPSPSPSFALSLPRILSTSLPHPLSYNFDESASDDFGGAEGLLRAAASFKVTNTVLDQLEQEYEAECFKSRSEL